ncbi:MAG: S41 family peptidase [Patescibacteria group bacterium]|nr:S41 family peptidase [Patescibacteria group bacterium]
MIPSKVLTKKELYKDLTFLEERIIKLHPNPFFNISKKKFRDEIDQIRENKNCIKLSDFAFIIMMILAQLKDSHTKLSPSDIYLGDKNYPISIRYFKNGYYIIKSKNDEKDLVGQKIVAINGISTTKIENLIKPIIALENDISLTYYLPQYLIEPSVFSYFKLTPTDPIIISLNDVNGKKSKIEIYPENHSVKLYSQVTSTKGADETLLEKDIYWLKEYKNNKSLYLQYNSCKEKTNLKIKDIVKNTNWEIFNWFVIDFRNNSGGDSDVLLPLISHLKSLSKKIRIVLLVSEKTFSSAIINTIALKHLSRSVSIGSKPHGSPTHFGELDDFILPNSELQIEVSTKLFVEEDYKFGESFIPDITVETPIHDYLKGIDTQWRYFMDNTDIL